MALFIRAGREPEPEAMVEINTTPLVDVMLVLLVMLIITIPLQMHAVSIETPGLAAAQPDEPPQVVRIDVLPGGVYAWDGTPLTAGRDELEARLRAAATQPRQPEIHLRPHPAAKYEAVAAAMSAAQNLGLQKIGLVGVPPAQ